MIYRIEGVKYNLQRLHEDELTKIRDGLVQKVKYLMQDLTVIESVLLERQLVKLPFSDLRDKHEEN